MPIPMLSSIIPKGSLNRLSPMRVPDMSSLMFSFLNVGIRDAGSVGEIIAPKMNPTMNGAPVRREKNIPAPTAYCMMPRGSHFYYMATIRTCDPPFCGNFHTLKHVFREN